MPECQNGASGIADQVECLTSLQQMLAFVDQWRDLERRVPDILPFQSFEWCRSWAEANDAQARPQALRIIAVFHEGRLVLLWPLAIRRFWGFRIAHSLGEPLTQYSDALVEDSDQRPRWLETAWDEIRSWRDVDTLELRRVRMDAAVAHLRPRWHPVEKTTDAAPFVTCGTEDRSGPLRQRSSRTRNTLRRHLRKLEALGLVTLKIVDPSQHEEAVKEALWL